MKLMQEDIKKKEFKKVLRGYSPEEVDTLLAKVVESFEELDLENKKLQEQLNSNIEKLEHYENLEATIQSTLLLAQNAAEQVERSSKREAEMIVVTANESAQRIIDKAHNDVITIYDEYDKVKSEFIKFRKTFRGFMNTQLSTFDELEKELTKNYNVSEETPELEVDIKEIGIDNLENEKLIEEEDMSEIKSFYANNK